MDLIEEWIKMIRSGTYGKDIRSPIIDTIELLAKKGGKESMAIIEPYLEKLRTTNKGEEMRSAIADALQILSESSGVSGGDLSVTFDKKNNIFTPDFFTHAPGPSIDTYLSGDPYMDDDGFVALPFLGAIVYDGFPILRETISPSVKGFYKLEIIVTGNGWGYLNIGIKGPYWSTMQYHYQYLDQQPTLEYPFGTYPMNNDYSNIEMTFFRGSNYSPTAHSPYVLKLALWPALDISTS